MKTAQLLEASGRKKIWIDLDNSPHVPFFAPIIDELDRRGYSLILISLHVTPTRYVSWRTCFISLTSWWDVITENTGSSRSLEPVFAPYNFFRSW